MEISGYVKPFRILGSIPRLATMIKKLSKILLISLIFIGGIKISLGAVLITTYPTSQDTTEDWTTADIGNTNTGLGQQFQATGSTIDGIKVQLKKFGSPTGNLKMFLYSCGTLAEEGSYCAYNGTTEKQPKTLIGTSTTILDSSTIATSYTDYTFDFNDIATVSGQIYLWVLRPENASNHTGANHIKSIAFATNSPSVYFDDNCSDAITTGEFECTFHNFSTADLNDDGSLGSTPNTSSIGPGKDRVFEITGAPAEGVFSIIITEPTDAQTYTTTFIQENGLVVQGECYTVSTVTVDMYSISKGWLIDKKSTTCTDNAFLVLLDVAEVWNDDYQINAYNFIGPGSTNDQIEITVNITSNPRVIPESALPDIEDTGSSFFVDCSSYDSDNFFTAITGGGFFCYLKKTLFAFGAFLLEPAESVTNQFEGSINDIKNDFPFSVFFDITTILENEIETAPTGATLSITFPEPLNHTFNILTPTLMEDVVGEDLKNDVFNAVEILTWSLVGFAILATVF